MPGTFLEQLTNGALKFIEKRIDRAAAIVSSAIEKASNKDVVSAVNLLGRSLTSTMQTELRNMKAPVLSADVILDSSALEAKVEGATAAVKKLSIPTTKNIEATLMLIFNALEIQRPLLSSIATAITGQKLNIPGTMKLDDQQLMALTGSLRGGSTVATTPQATRVGNTTVAATSTSTEYSYTFPGGCVGWLIKTRDQGTLGYYSWTTGKLPSSGTSTTYMTIPQNFLRSQEGVDYSNKKIFLGADTASTVFEIEYFLV